MIYFNNSDPEEYVTWDALSFMSDQERAEYHCAEPRELYDFIERKTDEKMSFDAVLEECYASLAYMCDVDLDNDDNDEVEREGFDGFLEKCRKVIEAREADEAADHDA